MKELSNAGDQEGMGNWGDGKRVSSYTPVNASLLHEPVAITRCQWRSEPVPMAFMEEETRR